MRTRARQRKVVSVHVSASMGVFVCLRFRTCVYESGVSRWDVFGTTWLVYPRIRYSKCLFDEDDA